MTSSFSPSAEVRRIREQVGHPILDADAHQIEFGPLLRDILRDVAGPSVEKRLNELPERSDGIVRYPGGFGFPGRNTLDRVTATLPRLLYDRLDEIGIDFALLYPTTGLGMALWKDAELRQAVARALNIYAVEVFDSYRDRLEPVATIPSVTPEEAVTELRHAVGELGLKTVVMSGAIPRTTRTDGTQMVWIDTLGHGSLFDYDPVWEACRDLRVAPSFHGIGMGWGSRVSSSNFVHNHLGHFGAAQEAVCRSLIMGGVPWRFPELRFAFLEGGVSWAAQLLNDLVSHFAKRQKDVLPMYDPAEQDPILRESLFLKYADGRLAGRADRIAEGFMIGGATGGQCFDDFAESGVVSPEMFVDVFSRQLAFGCEADDPMNALAFDRRLLPNRTTLNAMFASDIGHFDVPDMRDVLSEAYELVENGVLDDAAFRRFSCDNFLEMMTAVNPGFFDGTTIESYAHSQAEQGGQRDRVRASIRGDGHQTPG